MGRSRRTSGSGTALREVASEGSDRLPQESWVHAATGSVRHENLPEVNEILSRFYGKRFAEDTHIPGDFQELFDRGEVLLERGSDGEVAGAAGLLFEPSRDREAALNGSLSRDLWPTQAALPVVDAESKEAYDNLILRAESAAREAGKKELLLYEDSVGDSRGSEEMLNRGYTFRGVEREGRHSGKFIFAKDLDNPKKRGEGFDLEEAAKRKGSGWKRGHYNNLSLDRISSADPEAPLTLTYFDDEKGNAWESSKSGARFSQDTIHDAFSEIAAQKRSLESIDRFKDKNGRTFSTWTFSPSAGRRSSATDHSGLGRSLSSEIFSAEPPLEILNDSRQDELEMLYFEAAQGANDLEEGRQDLFFARRQAERDLVQRGIEPDEDQIENSFSVARARQRVQGALWETEGGWDAYSKELAGRMESFSLSTDERQEKVRRIREVREHLDSFKDFFAS